MRSLIGFNSWILVGVLALTTSCVQYWAGMVFNKSNGPIEISFAVQATPSAVDNLTRCRPSSHLPTQRLGIPFGGGAGPAADWKPVEGAVRSADQCEITFVLPARSAAKVFENSFCNDHAKSRDQIVPRAYQPQFSYLAIRSAQGNQRWYGWAASEQFRRNSQGDCVLVWK
jgi:hypothetical protein